MRRQVASRSRVAPGDSQQGNGTSVLQPDNRLLSIIIYKVNLINSVKGFGRGFFSKALDIL